MNKSNLKINLFYKTIYQIIILITPLIITPYISRVLGVEGVGVFSYYNSIVLYFSYFSMLGISIYGNRCIAKSKNKIYARDKTFISIYLLQLITSIISVIVYFISIYFSNNKIISLIMGLYLVNSLFDISWFYYGLEEFKKPIIFQIISRITTFILIFLLVKSKSDLWVYALLKCLTDLFASLCLWFISFKKIKIKKVKFKEVISHLKPCFILFIPIISASIYQHMDKIMLGIYIDKIEVGYYESASKLIVIILGIITSILAVLTPKISNLLSLKKDKDAKKLFNISMEITMCIGVALAFGIASISKEFVPLFFGNEFYASIDLSIMLSISIIFISWSNTLKNLYLVPYEKDKIYVMSVIVGALVNLIFNFIFIPKLHAVGAVIGTLFAEFSVALYQTIVIRKELNLFVFIKKSSIFVIFGFIMMIIVRFIAKFVSISIIGVFIEILFGTIIYIVLSLVYFYNNGMLKIFFKNKDHKF